MESKRVEDSAKTREASSTELTSEVQEVLYQVFAMEHDTYAVAVNGIGESDLGYKMLDEFLRERGYDWLEMEGRWIGDGEFYCFVQAVCKDSDQ